MGWGDDFVAGGEVEDVGIAGDEGLDVSDAGEEGENAVGEGGVGWDEDLVFAGVRATFADVRIRFTIEDDNVITLGAGVFDHDNLETFGGEGGASGDLDRFALLEEAWAPVTGPEEIDDVEAGVRIIGTDGEAIERGAVERRLIFRSEEGFAEEASGGSIEGDAFGVERQADAAEESDDLVRR